MDKRRVIKRQMSVEKTGTSTPLEEEWSVGRFKKCAAAEEVQKNKKVEARKSNPLVTNKVGLPFRSRAACMPLLTRRDTASRCCPVMMRGGGTLQGALYDPETCKTMSQLTVSQGICRTKSAQPNIHHVGHRICGSIASQLIRHQLVHLLRITDRILQRLQELLLV